MTFATVVFIQTATFLLCYSAAAAAAAAVRHDLQPYGHAVVKCSAQTADIDLHSPVAEKTVAQPYTASCQSVCNRYRSARYPLPHYSTSSSTHGSREVVLLTTWEGAEFTAEAIAHIRSLITEPWPRHVRIITTALMLKSAWTSFRRPSIPTPTPSLPKMWKHFIWSPQVCDTISQSTAKCLLLRQARGHAHRVSTSKPRRPGHYAKTMATRVGANWSLAWFLKHNVFLLTTTKGSCTNVIITQKFGRSVGRPPPGCKQDLLGPLANTAKTGCQLLLLKRIHQL
jgi:hypothetical protein